MHHAARQKLFIQTQLSRMDFTTFVEKVEEVGPNALGKINPVRSNQPPAPYFPATIILRLSACFVKSKPLYL